MYLIKTKKKYPKVFLNDFWLHTSLFDEIIIKKEERL